MTPAHYRKMAAAAKAKPNKYGARKAPCQFGHVHDSAREAARCTHLNLMQRARQISELEHQPKFFFEINGKVLKHPGGRRVGVTFDFTYRENGQLIAEDSKGHRVRDWPLRRAVFEALFPEYEVRES